MKDHTKAIKVTDKVYWVGAIDWAIRDFHGYTTDRGAVTMRFLLSTKKSP